jgi:hypothetical protein
MNGKKPLCLSGGGNNASSSPAHQPVDDAKVADVGGVGYAVTRKPDGNDSDKGAEEGQQKYTAKISDKELERGRKRGL